MDRSLVIFALCEIPGWNLTRDVKEVVEEVPGVQYLCFTELQDMISHPQYGSITVFVPASVTSVSFQQVLRDNPIEWVHSLSVAVHNYMVPEFLKSDIVMTAPRGVMSRPLAEFAMSSICYFYKGLGNLLSEKEDKIWNFKPSSTIYDKTLLILGYGDIGRATAKVAKEGFSMRVLGIKNSPHPDKYADEIRGHGCLHQLLPQADVLLMCLPHSVDTENIIGEPEIALMKSTSIIINLGRGMSLDEDAVEQALRENRLRGATLDVLKKEPLPKESTLWTCPNLLLSFHSAFLFDNYPRAFGNQFKGLISDFLAGRPLKATVDKSKGY